MLIHVNGEDAARSWILESPALKVVLKAGGLGLSVVEKHSGAMWNMEPERRGFTIQKAGRQFDKPLADLQLREWREVREGVFRGVELLSVPKDAWNVYNVRVRVLLNEDAPELLVSVRPHEDPGHTADVWVREVHFPRAFEHSASPKAYTVLPLVGGVLVPGNLEMAFDGEDAMDTFSCWGWNNCASPWWGHVRPEGTAYAAVIETPDDADFDFVHALGGPTRIAPRWLTSFEALRYERRVRYRFYAQADYVQLALWYRECCCRIGRWRSIEEKLLEKPQLARVSGAAHADGPHGTMALCNHLGRTGMRRTTRTLKTFAAIAAEWEAFAQAHPGENLFFTLRGWQVAGYDHMHPAACPPSAECGGWDGLRAVAEVARKHHAIFSVHEQYRDFFLSSPWFSEERMRRDARRDSPRHHYWAGGTQSILCPALMLDFIKMNVQQLIDQQAAPNATYQDVLTAIPLEECYDQRHPVNRTQCRQARLSIFDYYRTLGWLITSECATDWAVQLADSMPVKMPQVNHGAHAGQIPGIPVPLYSIAFHDSVLLNNWGVDPLHAALWGVNLDLPRHPVLMALCRQTAIMPLTAHRLLNDEGTLQESVFGDAVRVRVDMTRGTYEVQGLTSGNGCGVVDVNGP